MLLLSRLTKDFPDHLLIYLNSKVTFLLHVTFLIMIVTEKTAVSQAERSDLFAVACLAANVDELLVQLIFRRLIDEAQHMCWCKLLFTKDKVAPASILRFT